MSSLLRVHLALLPVRISSLMVTIITTVAFEEWGGLYAFPSTEDQHLPNSHHSVSIHPPIHPKPDQSVSPRFLGYRFHRRPHTYPQTKGKRKTEKHAVQ